MVMLQGAPHLLIKVELLALGLGSQLLLGRLVVLLVHAGQRHARLRAERGGWGQGAYV